MTSFTSFSKEPSPKKSKGQVMMLSKSKWRRPYFLTFYVKDNQLHLMLPLVFFLGLFEAFMSKTFLTVSALISNFLWTGSSHQTLDKHEKLKFLNVGTWCISVKPNSVFLVRGIFIINLFRKMEKLASYQGGSYDLWHFSRLADPNFLSIISLNP